MQKNSGLSRAVSMMLGLPFSNFISPANKKKAGWIKAHQGAQECARRVRQGNAPSCYNPHLKYLYQYNRMLTYVQHHANIKETIKAWNECQCVDKAGLKLMNCGECSR